MTHRIGRAIISSGLFAIIGMVVPAVAQQSVGINRGVVELETAGSAGISVRIGEELANLIDDGATRRLVPVVGKGALQNLLDLKYLRGIDMAILPIDVLDYASERKLIPANDPGAYYITKLYNEEFHLLARRDIKAVANLSNRKVNVGPPGSGSAITASRLFEQLKVPVTMTNEPQELALESLRNGEIPFNQAANPIYVPTRFTAADYPGLVEQDRPVNTVAVGSLLAVAELRLVPERNRNITNFVETFFTGFQTLLEPGHHPKWHEVNIAADLPGWRRYPAAEQWLQRNLQIAKGPTVDELRLMFARFIDERRQAAGEAPMPAQEKSALFQRFRAWQTGQAR